MKAATKALIGAGLTVEGIEVTPDGGARVLVKQANGGKAASNPDDIVARLK